MRHAFYDWLRRHRYFVDALLVGLILFVFWWAYGAGTSLSATAILTVWMFLPLIWRRRYPTAVFTVISLLCLVQLVVVGRPMPGDLAFLMALYAVSAYAKSRRIRVAALGVGLLGAMLGSVAWAFDSDARLTMLGLMGVMVAFSWTLGDSMRTRRAYVGQLEERARRLEYERDQQARLARSAERTRIAREVHDIIAHSLSIVIAQADGGLYAARQDPSAATKALKTIGDTGRHALAETRRLLNVLRAEDPVDFDETVDPPPAAASPSTDGSRRDTRGRAAASQEEPTGTSVPRQEERADDPAGASRPSRRKGGESQAEKDWVPQPDLSGIDDLIDRFRDAGLPVELTVHGTPPRTSAGFELAAYRIVQEALTNTFKHGGPGVRAEVTLEHGARSSAPASTSAAHDSPVLRIRVVDDGRGAAAPRPSTGGGHGIVGMRERAALYGGGLRAGPRPGGGFEVVAELPYVS